MNLFLLKKQTNQGYEQVSIISVTSFSCIMYIKVLTIFGPVFVQRWKAGKEKRESHHFR